MGKELRAFCDGGVVDWAHCGRQPTPELAGVWEGVAHPLAPMCILASFVMSWSSGALFVSAHVQMAHLSVCSCPLCSLPVCLQSRPCRETQNWSWRAAPWPPSPTGTASWRPVSPFPRSPGRMGPARAWAVLSVCTPHSWRLMSAWLLSLGPLPASCPLWPLRVSGTLITRAWPWEVSLGASSLCTMIRS